MFDVEAARITSIWVDLVHVYSVIPSLRFESVFVLFGFLLPVGQDADTKFFYSTFFSKYVIWEKTSSLCTILQAMQQNTALQNCQHIAVEKCNMLQAMQHTKTQHIAVEKCTATTECEKQFSS